MHWVHQFHRFFRSGGGPRFASGSGFSQHPAGFPATRPVSSGTQSAQAPSRNTAFHLTSCRPQVHSTHAGISTPTVSVSTPIVPSRMCVAPAGVPTPLSLFPMQHCQVLRLFLCLSMFSTWQQLYCIILIGL